MITIENQTTRDAGRCQGCRENHQTVWVIEANASNITINQLRLCQDCVDELRQALTPKNSRDVMMPSGHIYTRGESHFCNDQDCPARISERQQLSTGPESS